MEKVLFEKMVKAFEEANEKELQYRIAKLEAEKAREVYLTYRNGEIMQ